MEIIRTTLIYIFLFLLFYFEPQKIGPITFSQLWKIPLFVYLFWQVLVIRRKQKPSFIKWSYARAAKNLIIGRIKVSFVPGIIDFIRYMMFPLMFEFANFKIKGSKKIDVLLIGFAQFIIISGLPFILGYLKSKSRSVIIDENFDSYTGIFQVPHSASIATAISVLILLAFLKLNANAFRFRWFNYILILFGIYLLFLTYVRTGYVMFAVGFIILFIPQKLSLKQIVSATVLVSLLVFSFIYLLETNEFFYNRIFDIRNGKETAAGSGRLVLWQSTWDLWYNGNAFEMIFGTGFDGLVEHNYKMTGQKVYAHNEIFTQLGQNGFIGVVLFVGYLIALFRFIWKRRNRPSYRLAVATFALYFSLMMTQGGMWFQLDIFMALIFVKLEHEQVLHNKIKKIIRNN
jgi:hypothetical protein